LIDYVKIKIIDIDTNSLVSNNLLTFYRKISEKTGEYENKVSAKYHHSDIFVYDSGVVLFSGSIHKLYNSLSGIKAPNYKASKKYKGFNGNQFNLNNIIEVRTHLENIFDCKPHQMVFQNIEFGINTKPDFNPQIFIHGLLYQHGKQFEFRYNRHYAKVEHQRYWIKIYNKGNQYGMSENVLRIETKHLKSKEFTIAGIRTFADVNTKTLNNALKSLLIERFDKVVYYDTTIDKTLLNKRQKTSLKNYSNSNYWFDTLKSNKRDKHKKNLLELIILYSKNLQSELRKNLLQTGVIINRLSASQTGVIINTSSIGLNITQSTPKKCPITRLNISMQKDGSCLLSNTGLKYYEKNCPKQYKFLVKALLTGHDNKFERDVYTKLSKQIRNKYYNNPSLYSTAQISLFNLDYDNENPKI
tara:strand:+ start:4221 stop:5465 length:1245 start_codon:yes stop_codon:yes gene_type:complete